LSTARKLTPRGKCGRGPSRRLLPASAASRFFDAYEQADEATNTRARGWAVLRALSLIRIGQNGRLGLPEGKPTWEPAGYAALERVLAES